MPIAMLAPRRVAGMELSMLPIRVAMIFAMPTASAVAVPAAMLRPVIARHIAMISAMLPPGRIGSVQVAMILPGVAMVGPMAAAGLTVMVARRSDGDSALDLMLLRLPALGALGMRGFDTRGAFGALLGARFIALLARRFMVSAVVLATLFILRHRRHRRAGRKQDSQYQFPHGITPDEQSSLTTASSSPDDERMMNDNQPAGGGELGSVGAVARAALATRWTALRMRGPAPQRQRLGRRSSSAWSGAGLASSSAASAIK